MYLALFHFELALCVICLNWRAHCLCRSRGGAPTGLKSWRHSLLVKPVIFSEALLWCRKDMQGYNWNIQNKRRPIRWDPPSTRYLMYIFIHGHFTTTINNFFRKNTQKMLVFEFTFCGRTCVSCVCLRAPWLIRPMLFAYNFSALAV